MKKTTRSLLSGMGTLTALLLASMSAPAAWPADEQDPTGMEVNPVVKVEPPTAAQEAEFAVADRAAQEHYLVLLAVRDAHLTGDRAVVDSARVALDESTANLVEQSGTDEFGGDSVLSSCPDGDCSWSYVTRITHSAQTTSYWCGPATGVMLVKGWSSPTQSSMADAMGTTTAGTGWATGPNAPIPSGINAYNGARRDSRELAFLQAVGPAPTEPRSSSDWCRTRTQVEGSHRISGKEDRLHQASASIPDTRRTL